MLRLLSCMKLVLSRVLGTTAFAAKTSSPFLPLPQWIKFRLWYLQTSKLITITSTLLYKTVLTKNIKMEVAKTKVHTGSSCAVRVEKEGPGLTSSQARVRPRSHMSPPGTVCDLQGGEARRGKPPSHTLPPPAVREPSGHLGAACATLLAPKSFPSVCVSAL